jgi:DNA-binding NtrC family response regulator
MSQPVAHVETIVIVDDEVLVRAAIADYLRGCGYKVLEAASAEEALALLEADSVPVNVVLSAVALRSRMDGFGLLRWIREHHPDIEVILAGTPARAANAAAELCDSGPMLARPYDPQIVLDRIRRMLAARSSKENR